MDIFVCNSTPKRAISPIDSKAFHIDMLFDADRESMERSNRLSMLRQMSIELLCSLDGSLREQFSYTICLQR